MYVDLGYRAISGSRRARPDTVLAGSGVHKLWGWGGEEGRTRVEHGHDQKDEMLAQHLGQRLHPQTKNTRQCVFFTLATGPRRSLSLKLSDKKIYEPQMQGCRVGGWGGCRVAHDEVDEALDNPRGVALPRMHPARSPSGYARASGYGPCAFFFFFSITLKPRVECPVLSQVMSHACASVCVGGGAHLPEMTRILRSSTTCFRVQRFSVYIYIYI